MDFLMKQQLITLNANCQLIQCTHITNLLSNLKGLLDSMIIKVSIVRCKMSHVHRCAKITKCSSAFPWLHCHLHLTQVTSLTYITGCLCQKTLQQSSSVASNIVRDFLFSLFLVEISCLRQTNSNSNSLLENLVTVKLGCLKHCQRLFVLIIFSRNFMPQTNKFNT